MRGLVRRALPALILPPLLIALAFLSPGSLARSPRGSYARFLPVGSPRMLRIPGPAGRRTPLTREMLPHLFDNWPRAKSRQGSAPDTPLTPTATDTEEIMPNWAPEPTLETIAFASNGVDADGDGQIDPGPPPPGADFKIWLMRADGSQQRPVTDLPELSGADELDPAFDPGSRLIAFASNATGQFEIYQIDVATKVVTQITSSPPGSGDKRHPTWSADRSLIAFQWKKPGQSWDIYTVPSSGAGSPTLLIGDPSNDTSPAYHPTVATQLAFVSDRVGGVDKIFLHDAGFATPLQLTDGGGNPAVRDRDPAWRIAGTMLAFSSDRRTSPADPFDDFNIWTVGSMGEVGGAIPTLRTNRDETDDTDDVDPAWSPFDIGTPPPDQPPGTPPIVQVVHASNRPVGAGDVLADFNIWSFIENDVTPVRLLALPWIGDPDFNETNRLFMPGEDITIHAQLDDLDSGVGRVFAQIKDPDGPVEDFANVDHQDYFIYGTLFNGTSLPGTAWAHFDFDFFAGASQVELFDDGDVAAHGDAVAGDGIFSGIFTTSLTPSDFFIDLLTTDQAGNFMEYDQIYGFSTQIFNPQNNILLVDDYGSGQMFPYTTFTQHFQPVTDAISYYLFNPSGVDAGTLFPEYPNIWFHTFGTYDTWVISNPAQVSQGLAERVDVWRILARGPVPRSVLDFYGPTTEVQLDPGDFETERIVPVADRCIWWAAPHAGNVFPVKGVITDPDTQAELMRFLDRGGRLAISGEDIGWALTLDGQQTNPFYTGYLHANFVRDDISTGNVPFSQTLEATSDTPTGADDFVAVDPWSETGNTHYVPTQGGISDGGPDTGDNPETLRTPAGGGLIPPPTGVVLAGDLADGWAGTAFHDVVSPGPGAAVTHEYGNNGPDAGIRYPRDPRANPGSYRTVYFAFGFANIHREYHTVNNFEHCRNYRGKLAHQTVCWLRTGTMTGHVLNVDGFEPIDPPPIVQVLGTSANSPVENAVRALADGSYTINGLSPTFHFIRATTAGFYDHLEFDWFHGGGKSFPNRIDIFMTKAPNGSISGTVTRLSDGAPLGNIPVRAFDPIAGDYFPPDGPVLTNADGTYVIPDLPASDYEVTADGTAQAFSIETQTVTVLPAQNLPNVDFQLTAADGFLDVFVVDADTGDPIANAVVHVLDFNTGVEITSDTTSAGIGNPPGETEEEGHRTFQLAPASDGYLVFVEAAGFQTSPQVSSGAIVPLATTELTVELQEVPGGSISGLVSRPDGTPVAGVTVQVISGGVVIAGPVVTDAVITEETLCNGQTVRYNYFVDGPPCGPEPGVPAGRHEVVATVSGLTVTPPSREAIVVTNEHTANVNFVVTPLHTFPAGLSMVSAPYDYTGLTPSPPFTTPAEALLGVHPLKMASYNPTTGSYVFHPNPPTNAFRLGLGYWLFLDDRRDVTTIAPTASDPYRIALEPGWNMIGGPFDERTDYFTVTVETTGGTVLSLPDAFAAGILQSGLWTWVFNDYHTSLEFAPWTGYWVLAFQRCTLIVPKPMGGTAFSREPAAVAAIEPFRAPANGWSIAIEAEAAGGQDTVNYLGAAADATDSFDAKYDMHEPPAPLMGAAVSLAFVGKDGPMAADIRGPVRRKASWDLLVTCAAPNTDVRLSWADLTALPGDCTATLIDLDADVRVAMRTQRAYVFRTGNGGGSRRLRVQVSREQDGRLAITDFRAEAVRGGMRLAYTLTRDAVVDIAITNIAGRTVRVLARADQRTRGPNAVAWDGASDLGTRVPAGTYLCRLRAVAADGQRVESLCPVVVSR